MTKKKSSISVWCNFPLLDELFQVREAKRLRGKRLAFDCYNLKYIFLGRAYCSRGAHLGQARDGTVSIISVLRGYTPNICRKCTNFNN